MANIINKLNEIGECASEDKRLMTLFSDIRNYRDNKVKEGGDYVCGFYGSKKSYTNGFIRVNCDTGNVITKNTPNEFSYSPYCTITNNNYINKNYDMEHKYVLLLNKKPTFYYNDNSKLSNIDVSVYRKEKC
tara:strand:+ start:3713 stop:4108 length:396 start_codon:yes stop_codon:yes gene_type:complete